MRTLNKILLVVSLLAVAFVVYKIFFPSEKAKATTYYQTQSKGEGSAEETFIRAMKYMTGEDNFPQNSNMAAKLLKEAAEKGHANAQFNLAVCFARGIGVNMDHGQTLIWLEKAAANGHPQAKEFLEELERDGGLEAPADLKEVTEAAEKGDAEAQCKLAMIYYMGQGVPTDLTPKGREVYDMLQEADQSKLPIYDEAKMKEYFNFFSDLDRNQDFDTYLKQFQARLHSWLETH